MQTLELRFRVLLSEDGAEPLELVKAQRALGARLQNSTDALASMRNCKTPDFRFRALLSRGGSELEVALAQVESTDPNNLDADNDGQACEELSPGVAPTEGGSTENGSDSGARQCAFFLRVVGDDRGTLRDQYRDDELIVQRFEQCLSGDVLADTIPNRNLPFTGGMSLLFLGAIGLAAIVAGISVLRAVMRHGG